MTALLRAATGAQDAPDPYSAGRTSTERNVVGQWERQFSTTLVGMAGVGANRVAGNDYSQARASLEGEVTCA